MPQRLDRLSPRECVVQGGDIPLPLRPLHAVRYPFLKKMGRTNITADAVQHAVAS